MTRPRQPWQPAEIAVVRRSYANTATAEIARQLGRTPTQVYQKAYALGIKKSPEFFAGEASGRLTRGHSLGAGGRFKPGDVPWNKDQHYQPGGRSVSSRFAPGSKHGYAAMIEKPVGAYRITSRDKVLQIKTGMRSGPSHLRWTPVARIVWEAAHGPIPPKMIIIFKPGMKTTVLEQITVDRLECITRRENARRNSIHTKNPELAGLYQLKGAITRQVNRITKTHQDTQP